MKFLGFKFNLSSGLIYLTALIAAVFLAIAGTALWRYLRLEASAPVAKVQWAIIQKSSSQFALKATYYFDHQGKIVEGETLLSKPYYLNQLSAEKKIQEFSKQKWRVWYDRGTPEISSLEKRFPAKKILYALMTLGIFFYFYFMLNKPFLKDGKPIIDTPA